MAMASMSGSVQIVGQRALGHDDDEGPALGVVAHRLGKADLRLPHAFRAALAAAMQEEDDGPLLVVVAAPVFRQVDLKAVGDAVQLDLAIQKAGLLGGLGVRSVSLVAERLRAAWVELARRR